MTQSDLQQFKQELENKLLKKPVKELENELMQLIHLVPEQAKETTIDVVSTTLSRGYNKEVFDQLVKFIQAILNNHSQKEIDAKKQNTQALLIQQLQSSSHQR